MHRIKAYLRFLWRSTNQHGIHSPFVYELVTQCFYDKRTRASYLLLEQYRKKLLQDSSRFKVVDTEAEGKGSPSSHGKRSEISRNAIPSRKRAKLLNRLVGYLPIKTVLELETSVGLRTAAMAAENQVKVISLGSSSPTAGLREKYLQDLKLVNVEVRAGKLEILLDSLTSSQIEKMDLIFFGGIEEKELTLKYFERLLPLAHNDSVFIFDAIHSSKETEAAWEEIKTHPAVRVSIDTFQWGLIFFRREQEKQHFSIRV